MNTKNPLTEIAGIAAAVIIGLFIATQVRINGELATRIDDGYVAAVISFGSGLIVMVVALGFSRAGRAGFGALAEALRARRLPWWGVLGGLSGALFVLSQGLTVGSIGVALFMVAVVSGQTLSGLLVDRFGIGPAGRAPITPARIIGAALCLVAVGIVAWGGIAADAPLWMLIIPALAGVGVAWQQAVNGRVRIESYSAVTATFLNFAFGTAALLVVLAVHALTAELPASYPSEPWLYLGGPIGVVFVAAGTIVVRFTGVLVLGLGTVAGQLLGSLLIEIVAPADGPGPGVPVLVGTALTLVAVLIASGVLTGSRGTAQDQPAA